MTAWHALPADRVVELLDSSPEGLPAGEAARRLRAHGPNRLEATPPTAAWRILLEQFESVVVLLLVLAMALATALGDVPEAAAIGVVLLLNAGIGFTVELRSRRAMEALLRYTVPWATVIRAGRTVRIPAEELVPGDVVRVAAGQTVPADARLLEAWELRASEAPLTGEFAPVSKAADVVPEDRVLAERNSMIFTGTSVTAGHATAVVVATGRDTEVGRIGVLVASVKDEETPLEKRLDALGKRLVVLTLVVAALVVTVGVLQGLDLTTMIETGIALAIAAVPEGLPAVATITLAVGLRRMARRNALIRRLSAVEALGSITVVCADKTGTLTSGQMTVTRLAHLGGSVEVTGSGYEEKGAFEIDGREVDPAGVPVIEAALHTAALTTDARIEPDGGIVGEPTDAALLIVARKAGAKPDDLRTDLELETDIPFSSSRPLTGRVFRRGAHSSSYVKGAPSEVLSRCDRCLDGAGARTLTPADRQALESLNREMAASGLRVIALARSDDVGVDPLRSLTFLVFAGITDPPAGGVADTVTDFREAGIRTVMITGDQEPTARAIADSLGIEQVYARTSPERKLDVVAELQESGEIVAMLGDGVNDAPALKKADIGVAMGARGTDAAKETADVVLQDDRFPTIAAAIEEGRVIFDNIRKFVFYLFGCNVAEVLTLLAAGVAALPLPLLPLQILWLNLVTDTFPALALAMEPAEEGIMTRPPRPPGSAIMSRRFVNTLLFYSGLITVVSMGAFLWALGRDDPARAPTVAFMTLALAQLFHLGTARAHGPVLAPARAFANRWAVAAIPLVIGLQLLAVYAAPLQRVLRTVPLTLEEWAVIVAAALAPAIVGQGIRLRRAVGAPAAGS